MTLMKLAVINQWNGTWLIRTTWREPPSAYPPDIVREERVPSFYDLCCRVRRYAEMLDWSVRA